MRMPKGLLIFLIIWLPILIAFAGFVFLSDRYIWKPYEALQKDLRRRR